jgi:hypothetical protein
VIRRRELDTRIASDSGASLGNDLAVDGHLAGQNQRARPLAGRRESEVDEGDIQSSLCNGH